MIKTEYTKWCILDKVNEQEACILNASWFVKVTYVMLDITQLPKYYQRIFVLNLFLICHENCPQPKMSLSRWEKLFWCLESHFLSKWATKTCEGTMPATPN